jgi:hypothetical protein
MIGWWFRHHDDRTRCNMSADDGGDALVVLIALSSLVSAGPGGRSRTDELLLHIHRGANEPLRVYLSKLNLAEVEDPNAAVIVSSFRENVPVRTQRQAWRGQKAG